MPNPYSPEFKYLFGLIQYRVDKSIDDSFKGTEPTMPAAGKWGKHLALFIKENRLDKNAAILLLTAMAPHVYPHLFDDAIGEKLGNLNFPKIGGTHGKNFRGFLPTGETAVFIIAGEDQQKRADVQTLFQADHLFADKKILWLESLPEGEPPLHGRIIMSQDYIDVLTRGKHLTPHFSISFPAKAIRTNLTWNDLVINNELKEQIDDLKSWLRYNEQLTTEWGMGDRIKKGYRALFYGPAGTGKTFTAGLLGKEVGKDVYKIDLSMVVSKYIGETEKNLEVLFARAEDKGWILFFDEADALFGKRTNVKDAHDKYANQEVSYLLQRIEDYDGMVILATNMKNNIDDAFIRRFNAILKFSLPDADERAKIWKISFPTGVKFYKRYVPLINNNDGNRYIEKYEEVNIPEEVKKFQLSGGNIINVVHFASIKALEKLQEQKNQLKMMEEKQVATADTGGNDFFEIEDIPDTNPPMVIYLTDVLEGIKKEFSKEGKPFN
jgi:DNA polymerase III delta prime subunit